jgi:hypothetical protein
MNDIRRLLVQTWIGDLHSFYEFFKKQLLDALDLSALVNNPHHVGLAIHNLPDALVDSLLQPYSASHLILKLAEAPVDHLDLLDVLVLDACVLDLGLKCVDFPLNFSHLCIAHFDLGVDLFEPGDHLFSFFFELGDVHGHLRLLLLDSDQLLLVRLQMALLGVH